MFTVLVVSHPTKHWIKQFKQVTCFIAIFIMVLTLVGHCPVFFHKQ